MKYNTALFTFILENEEENIPLSHELLDTMCGTFEHKVIAETCAVKC